MPRTPPASASADGRRGFLARLAAAALAAGLPSSRALAVSPAAGTADPDAWLTALGGRHRQIFHTTEARDGRSLEQAATYLDAFPAAYGAPAADVRAVVAAHGAMLAMVLGDAIWRKYLIAEFGRFSDPRTAQPARRNPYLADGPGELLRAGASLPALARRGVVFLACDRALGELSRYTAAQGGRPPADAYAELRANLVPGTVVVPALVVSIGRAQTRGCTYLYCG